MCDKYSFVIDRKGKIYNGYGINSHSVICKLANLDEDEVDKLEYNPHEDNCYVGIDGLKSISIIFELSKQHLDLIEDHLNELFPTIESWDSYEHFKTDSYIQKLIELSHNSDCNIRFAVAKNPNTPIEIIEKLSEDIDWYVRQVVASNPNTPIEIIEKLSEDIDWNVRIAVASNPNTPIEIIEKLSEDKEWYVRQVVASNPNTPIEILKRLSTDTEWIIRLNVANNQNTPVSVLKELSDDKDDDVRDTAKERLSLL